MACLYVAGRVPLASSESSGDGSAVGFDRQVRLDPDLLGAPFTAPLTAAYFGRAGHRFTRVPPLRVSTIS